MAESWPDGQSFHWVGYYRNGGTSKYVVNSPTFKYTVDWFETGVIAAEREYEQEFPIECVLGCYYKGDLIHQDNFGIWRDSIGKAVHVSHYFVETKYFESGKIKSLIDYCEGVYEYLEWAEDGKLTDHQRINTPNTH